MQSQSLSPRFFNADPAVAWFDLCRCCLNTKPDQFPAARQIHDKVCDVSVTMVEGLATVGVVDSAAQRDAALQLRGALYAYVRNSLSGTPLLDDLVVAERVGVMFAAGDGLENLGVRLEIQ